jgi:hypothetical protein
MRTVAARQVYSSRRVRVKDASHARRRMNSCPADPAHHAPDNITSHTGWKPNAAQKRDESGLRGR